MLSRLNFYWRCRMRAVRITNRMSDSAIRLLAFVRINDMMGGAVPFASWLLTQDGQHELDDLEETLHNALAVVHECREKLPEPTFRNAVALLKEREDLPESTPGEETL